MKILFSPAETKKSGGTDGKITKESFLFPESFAYRKDVLDKYQQYISSASNEQLAKLFGIKDPAKFEKYKEDIYNQPLMKVVERYNGVAFDYLDYSTLSNDAKNYIDKNTMIFSNLFGPILAGDIGIPDYKLKQGEKINGLALEKFYNKHFTDTIDRYLMDEEIIDLRAGFYNKFYRINKPYTTMKFIKNDRAVSHWAKAYRGIVLNLIAQNNIQSITELMNMQINNLIIKEIKKQKNKTEIVYDIIE